MIANNSRIEAASNVYMTNLPQTKMKNRPIEATKTDRLVLSSQGRDFASFLGKLREMKPVRMEKVDYYREQVRSGTYQVDAQQLAKQILDASIY